jgi:multidrug efflux system membrane fusion protein
MISRQLLRWCIGGLVILTGVLAGCDSTPPVATTPPPPVTVSNPVVHEVTDYDDYEGRIAAVQTVKVRPMASGYVIKVAFQDGQIVKEGDLLFEIDPAPYKAALDAAKARKSFADADNELAVKVNARNAKLVGSGAATREEYEVSTAKVATTKAEGLKAAADVEKAKVDLGYTRIVAAVGGKISRAEITVGNLVTAGDETVLTTITTVDPMYVFFDVDERSLLRYRREFRKDKKEGAVEPSIKDLKIPVLVALDGDKGYPHKGVLDFADNRVNPSTGTIQVRGELPNTTRILDAGLRARVRIPIGKPHKSLLITERAIGTDQGRKFVYVVNAENVAERKDVELDRLSDGLQVIGEGLKPDDQIIVNGIQRVRDGMKVEPKLVPMPGAPAEQARQESRK